MHIKEKHILIGRTDNIGDVVLTLPMTAFIKRHNPETKISMVCRSYAAPIVRFCKTVDEVIEIEKVPDLTAYMRSAKVDAAIFAQPDRRVSAAAKAAGVPKRFGNLTRWFHFLEANRWLWFRMGSSGFHETQINFNFLRPLGIKIIPDRAAIPPLYQFDVPSDALIDQMLAPHAFNLIFHPKSNGNGREWPTSHYLSLAKLLAKEFPAIHIWITGQAKEGEWLQENAAELLQQPNVENICGKLSLEKFAILINSVDGLIASGTGPLHISAAFGQNTLGMFPPRRTMFPERWGAVGLRGYSLCEIIVCDGCYKKINRHAMTCDCMKRIEPSSALAVVSRWFDEKNGRLARNQHH